MSVCRLIVTASLLLSAVAFGADDVDLTQPAVLEDFDDIYGDEVHQTTVGAVFGLATEGAAYQGGGYWYVYHDDSGSSVTDFEGAPVSTSDASIINQEGELIVNLSTSDSEKEYPYAAVACNLLADDKDKIPLDLSAMTAISLKIKGEGHFRLLLKTSDIDDDWGHYGAEIDVPSDYETITINAEDLLPEEGHDAYKDDWTFAHGAEETYVLEFKAKNGDDATIYVDDIVAEGMTYEDFGWDISSVSFSSNIKKSTKMLSVKGSNISFNLTQPQNLTLSLNDIMGNRISTLFKGNVASKTVNLNNSNISNGRYFVILSGKNTKMVQPIAIMK